jgi:hypothetical protein
MRRYISILRRAALCAGSALLGAAASAGTFNADFNGGIPAGVNLQGHALDYDHSFGGVGNSGVLKLAGGNSHTEVLGSQSGGAIIDDFDNGAVIGGFDVTFDLYIGSGNGADGFSFFFGDFPDGAHSEEGPGNIEGLTVAFDVFNNATGAGIPEAPAIDLKRNNQILSHRLVGAASTTTGAQPLGTATTIRTQPTTGGTPVYWPVRIHVDTDGTVDVVYNNVVVFTNVPAFKPITEFTRGPGSARFGFAARTGGSMDNHWIDNLRITTVPLDASSGQPNVISMTPVALSSATAGAPGSGVGGATVRIQDNQFSVATNTVRFLYNNAVVTPTITREDDITTISYFGANGVLPSGVGTVNVTYFTTSNPAVSNNFSYTFVVAPVTTLPASWAVTGVNTAAPGFKGRIYQMDALRAPGDQNQTIMGERHLAFGYIDPATGQPFANIAILDGLLDANGYVDIPGVINFEQNAGNAGNINGGSNPSRPEEFFPGIPGQTGSTDNFAVEFLGYIYLTEGGHRFGVYADDRVRLSFGPAFQTVGTPILAASTGANQEVIADVFVTQAGYYPIRVSYWEGGGGAHVELYYILPSGQRILVNDPELTAAPRAYREATGSRPSISRVLPVENWIGASPDEDLIVDIRDGAIALNPSTVILNINGVRQNVTTTKSGNVTTIVRDSSMDNLLTTTCS